MLLGAVLVLLVLGGAGPASAHAALKSSDPSDAAVLKSAPRSVTLTFTESVGLLDDSFRVLDPENRRVRTGEARHASGRSDTARVTLPAKLAEGTYVVAWRVVSADSHPVSGAFTFSVGKPSATVASVSAGPVENPATASLYNIARYLAYLAAALLIGTAAFAVLCRPADHAPLRRPLLAGWWTLLGTSVVLLVLRAPYETGTAPGTAFSASALTRTLTGRPGLALLARLALLLIAAAAVVTLRKRPAWARLLLPAENSQRPNAGHTGVAEAGAGAGEPVAAEGAHSGRADVAETGAGEPGAEGDRAGHPGAGGDRAGRPGTEEVRAGHPGTDTDHARLLRAEGDHAGHPGTDTDHAKLLCTDTDHARLPRAEGDHAGHLRAGRGGAVRRSFLVGSGHEGAPRPLLLAGTPRPLLLVGAVFAVGLALTWALAEHASAGIQVPVAVVSSVLHLLAMAVWLGGLAALLILLRGTDVSAAVVARFSRLAFASVTVLVVTGVYQSWRGLGSWSALTGTTYGRLLLAKVAAVVLLLALAGMSRRWTARMVVAPARKAQTAVRERVPEAVGGPALPASEGPAPGHPTESTTGPEGPTGTTGTTGTSAPDPHRRALRRSVLAEVAVGVLVLVITTVLTGTLPGRAAAEAAEQPASEAGLPAASVTTVPFDVGTPGGHGKVQITLDPGRVGDNNVQAVVFGPDGGISTVPELRLSFSLPAQKIGPLDARVKNLGGYWGTNSLTLPIAGTWTMKVTVRTSDIDQVSVTKAVRIR
ncbi:copper resistance CopC/CopD family protein [Streptomyces cylindrosporus]|uniref:Copper resistance protein CopC/CopD n=1 Tax=Streptomyces cylindrosporus TaxID=2927583 RepID=A0ABS9YBH7_9ACTN|nr:copper resistance protein CopC [Streptomyces cylindrosporus]MCI3274578.1 copper resistance protein CopC/CopD [Streptomyces cylindrosporus]